MIDARLWHPWLTAGFPLRTQRSSAVLTPGTGTPLRGGWTASASLLGWAPRSRKAHAPRLRQAKLPGQ